MQEVDKYGIPLGAFGEGVPSEFFEILGRFLAVNGEIEYVKDRLGHLPASETDDVKKVEQFSKRYDSGRMERNGIVHSRWVFGAHTRDPEVILGVRYKTSRPASGDIATLSISDVPHSDRKQVIVQYRLDQLRKLLKRDVNTMLIGIQALTDVGLNWAARHASQ